MLPKVLKRSDNMLLPKNFEIKHGPSQLKLTLQDHGECSSASTSGLSSSEKAAPSSEECHDLDKSTVGTLKISEKDASISAELILTMKCVISHYSYASCSNFEEIFQLCFLN
ncbi:hypothetical protein PR048_000309 [Dryococelus australis]|uniref:Uncharacterized protein n=1 Tax=Dryococelus australis TaxID=614101 RepID=A0ABQ9IFK7_9NEOP|nr:hypothetical protein PR048_000309 [Dryococelus australis]